MIWAFRKDPQEIGGQWEQRLHQRWYQQWCRMGGVCSQIFEWRQRTMPKWMLQTKKKFKSSANLRSVVYFLLQRGLSSIETVHLLGEMALKPLKVLIHRRNIFCPSALIHDAIDHETTFINKGRILFAFSHCFKSNYTNLACR